MISQFNQVICRKISQYIDFFLERIEAASDTPITIKQEKFVVMDTNNFDINYLIVHGMTGSFVVKYYFKITPENGEPIEYSEDLEIPKMINNVFVIEGAMRIPTNTLDNDSTCTIYNQNFRLNDMVNIGYEEDPHEDGGYKLTLNIYLDEEPIICDGTSENFKAYSKYMKLTQYDIDKIKIKLDTDDVGDVLTRDIVIKLVKRGADKNYDNMIDKKIFSAESNLMFYLRSRDIRRRILTNMKTKFFQYNKIYLRDIQNALNRYFKVASEKNIDIPSTVNPLVFDAMRYKVIIPKNVAYNKSMTDVIDIVSTPIGVGSMNRINELNVCMDVKDDHLMISCYKYPSQDKCQMDYIHYLTKRVLLNSYWDYDKKMIKPDQDGNVKYKLRQKLYVEKPTSYDYIEPMPDDKLSMTSRRIPMGNNCDSVRLNMGTGMLKQTVEIDKSEPPLVSAGHDNEDYETSVLITRYADDDQGIITEIKDRKIFIKSGGTVQFIEVPNPTPGADDSVISFDVKVKIGDKVNKGDILIVPHILRRRSFETGLNVNAIYMNYLGYSHEDGIIISESLANRMIHYSVLNVVKEIYPDDIIKYIRPIGSKVVSKDVLVNNQTRLRVNQALKNTYTSSGGLLSGLGISFNQSNLIVPNNCDEAYVADVDIHIEEGRSLTNEMTLKLIEEFKSTPKSEEYDILPEKYRELKADPTEIGDKAAGYISYKLIRVDRCKIGDKLCNRWGSKGIVSLVIPDNCMPRIIRGAEQLPAEILLNPGGVLHRKNLSQIYECAITKCIEKIYDRVDQLVTEDNIVGAKKFLRTFYNSQFDDMTDAEFVKNHREKHLLAYQMKVGFYSKVPYETLLNWMKQLGIEEKEYIFIPSVAIAETKDGVRVFPLETYQPEPDHRNIKKYELGKAKAPCVTGVTYYQKLWKQANYDGKCTSEVMNTNEPLMGRGKYRDEGQKIGEMEMWILLETGSEKFLTEQSDSLVQNQYIFLNELLMSGYYIQDRGGAPILSPQRSRQKALEELGK